MQRKLPRNMCYGWLWENGSLSKVVSRLYLLNIILSTVVYEDHLADPDTIQVFDNYLGMFGEVTRLAMPKTNCAPDSSSVKPGSGATEGVLY